MLGIKGTLQSFQKKIGIFGSIAPVYDSSPYALCSASMISLIEVLYGYFRVLFLILRLFFYWFLRWIELDADDGSWSSFL